MLMATAAPTSMSQVLTTRAAPCAQSPMRTSSSRPSLESRICVPSSARGVPPSLPIRVAFHAGIPPQRAPRLLLQAQYSILPNFALHYMPVEDPSDHRLDSYVNRLILA